MDINWNKIKKYVSSLKDLRHIAGANILGKIIAGSFWFFIAGLLGTEDYGQVSYFIAIGSMVAALSMVGASNTIIVYAAKKVPIQPAIYVLTLCFGLIASVIVIIIHDSFETGIFVIGYIIFNLAISDLLGKKHYKKYSKIFILQKIIFASLSIGFYFILGYQGIILGYALSFLVFSYIIFLGFKENPINFSILKNKLGFMMNNYALSIERIFAGQLDKIIIAPLFGFSTLGNFSLSIQIFSVLYIIPGIVYQYTLSQDASGNSNLLIKKLSIIASIIVAILAFLLSPILIPLVFPQFTEVIQLVQIISFVLIPSAINSTYHSKFLGNERGRIILVGQGISASTYISGLLILGEIFGINGVAFSLLISAAAQTIFYYCTDRYFMDKKIFKASSNGYF